MAGEGRSGGAQSSGGSESSGGGGSSGGARSSTVEVRTLGAGQVLAAAALHEQLATLQFIARGGPALLVPYYRAWAAAPGAIALVAMDDDGLVVGALLGSSDPGSHHRAMLRRGAPALARGLAIAALTVGTFRRELVRTRLLRYARGVVRLVAPGGHSPGEATATRQDGVAAAPGERVGEITHVVVDANRRGSGAGRLLVAAALEQAAAAGCDAVELVTEAGSSAAEFYEHLGWAPAGAVESASGEAFARYRFSLRPFAEGDGRVASSPRTAAAGEPAPRDGHPEVPAGADG